MQKRARSPMPPPSDPERVPATAALRQPSHDTALPKATAEDSIIVDSSSPPVEESSPAGILIVDDDRATLLALSTVLQDLGDRVVCAASAEEALRCLLKDDFAII